MPGQETKRFVQTERVPTRAASAGITSNSLAPRSAGVSRDANDAAEGIEDLAEFKQLIGQYYAQHIASRGGAASGALSRVVAQERAQAIVEAAYRRQRLGISNACADAIDGTNGGIERIYALIRNSIESDPNGPAGSS